MYVCSGKNSSTVINCEKNFEKQMGKLNKLKK